MNDVATLLVVQEDKRHMGGSDPEPQLIAAAIAAFHGRNDTRIKALGKPIVGKSRRPVAGFTMRGTMPIFYRIPVTAELVQAVQLGEYPAQETVVYAHLPPVPRPAHRYSEGMKPLDNRRIVLSCFSAFQQYV